MSFYSDFSNLCPKFHIIPLLFCPHIQIFYFPGLAGSEQAVYGDFLALGAVGGAVLGWLRCWLIPLLRAAASGDRWQLGPAFAAADGSIIR